MLQPASDYKPNMARSVSSVKSTLGQYMTPPSIAAFMASLFTKKDGHMYLLDPGAGQGALSVAFMQRWRDGLFSFVDGTLDAFEIDHHMVSVFQKKINEESSNLSLSVNLQHGDFITQSVTKIMEQERLYTHAILNPPYKKINSNSHHRALLREINIETVNLYSAFVALSIAMLAPGGQLVAIIPRSFCNGAYYKPFRDYILRHTAILHIHLFDSRTKPFKADSVLQENVVLMLERDALQGDITVSSSTDDTMVDYTANVHPFNQIVQPSDPQIVFHIPSAGKNIAIYPNTFSYSLKDIGLEVSTGPVVDFRMKEYLHALPNKGDVPLLYPAHFKDGGKWPIVGFKKPNAIECRPETMKWLYPNGFYVVVRRMSSKEEKRRIVASIVDPRQFSGMLWLGFENHLNVFHSRKVGISEELAYGLAVYLNSNFMDNIFRRFNGHTQVNATDLRSLRYPSQEKLEALGVMAKEQGILEQKTIDRIMETILK